MGRQVLDKTKFYTTRYRKVYQCLEVNDGKGCNICQGHGRLCPLLVMDLLKDHGYGPDYSDNASRGILANN